MKIVEHDKRSHNDTDYYFSFGWTEPCDIRLQIINDFDRFDLFFSLDELQFLHEWIEEIIWKYQERIDKME